MSQRDPVRSLENTSTKQKEAAHRNDADINKSNASSSDQVSQFLENVSEEDFFDDETFQKVTIKKVKEMLDIINQMVLTINRNANE